MSEISLRVSLCQICGQLANGNHFGATSCRACAAFFRRANGSTDTFCPLGDCKIYKNGRFYCKKCRLRICYEVGMSSEKFQHDRDPISTSSSSPEVPKKRRSSQVPMSMAHFLGRPAFILSCEPDRASRVKRVIDVTFLINKATDILQNGDTRKYIAHDSLEKLTMKFGDLKKEKSSFKTIKVLGLAESMYFWEQDFLATASWLTHFDEFQALPLNAKMQILKVGWVIWGRLDKLAKTAEQRRKKVLDERGYMIGNDVCLDIQEFDVDVSWCTNYTKEQLVYYLDCHHDHTFNVMVHLLMDLNPTDVELNYMLAELCLQYAGKRRQGDVLVFTDKLLAIAADNLHNYYKHQRNIANYSGRVAKMIKVNNLIRKDLWERLERQEVAKVFNIINVQFSHPDMFGESGM